MRARTSRGSRGNAPLRPFAGARGGSARRDAIAALYEKMGGKLEAFYFAFGEMPDSGETRRMIRFYWNVTAEGAPSLVACITQSFNRFQVPFRLKCLTSRAQLDRCDGAVLYLPQRTFDIGIRLARRAHAEVAPHLRPETCLFARPVAPGLGFAEDPVTRESFGMTRCRQVAEGIVAAQQAGDESIEARTNAIAQRFRREGVDPDRPWLNHCARARERDPHRQPVRASVLGERDRRRDPRRGLLQLDG